MARKRKKRKPRKPRKGLTRSPKEWEESLATHIGKIIDNLKGEDILNLIAAGVCAYGGYHAGEVVNANMETKIGMAGTGVLAYQLAKSMNLVAGASGTAVLAGYTLVNLWNPLQLNVIPHLPTKEEIERLKNEWLQAVHIPTWEEYREKFWTKFRMP